MMEIFRCGNGIPVPGGIRRKQQMNARYGMSLP
jgi:hypothetical protein